ncbi:UNKNOWN [Stylonychia lemnae]|uniref:Transmembrane protein n=1 Tax=Stylonychia lemnae TaxID=5949 RepID=A0A078AGS3_STYLE|nr:UNKNOWN [Stylonychia lemnae]|eukprot:CDW80732.1 UNKNOWN [Stylonychia lemnae]
MKTLPGALATLVFAIIMILYLIFQLQSIGQVSQILYQQKYLTLEDQAFNLTSDNFYLEVAVSTNNTNEGRLEAKLSLLLELYVTTFDEQGKEKDISRVVLIPCDIQNDRYSIKLSSQYQTQVVYKVKNNVVLTSQSLLHESLDLFQKKFISYQQAQVNRIPFNETRKCFLDVQFELDGDSQQIKINRINLVQILSSVGGLAGTIFAVFKFFIEPISTFIFYRTIIKKTYLVDSSILEDKENRQNDDDKQKKKDQDIDNNKDPIQNRKGNNLQDKNDDKKDVQSFFFLIQKLLHRNPFSYPLMFAFKTYIKSLICCKKKYIHQQIYNTGKDMIDKQLDIGIILRDLRTFKMTNNLLINKFQKKMIPFLQPYLLNKKLESKQQKEKEQSQQSKELILKKFQQEKISNLIEFFSNYQNNRHEVDKVMFDQLLKDKEKNQHSLEIQMYSGILRQYVVNNLKDKKTVNKKKNDQFSQYQFNQNPIIVQNWNYQSGVVYYGVQQQNYAQNDVDLKFQVPNESSSHRLNNAADNMELLEQEIAEEEKVSNNKIPRISMIDKKE